MADTDPIAAAARASPGVAPLAHLGHIVEPASYAALVPDDSRAPRFRAGELLALVPAGTIACDDEIVEVDLFACTARFQIAARYARPHHSEGVPVCRWVSSATIPAEVRHG